MSDAGDPLRDLLVVECERCGNRIEAVEAHVWNPEQECCRIYG